MSDPGKPREAEEVPASWIETAEPPVRERQEERRDASPGAAGPGPEPSVAQDLWEEFAALRRSFNGLAGQSTAAYQVPKRFGMGPLMGMMLLYSVMFACLRWGGAPQWVYLFLGILGVVIGFGQMQGQGSPRFSSIVTGAVAMPGFMMAYIAFMWFLRGSADPNELFGMLCLSFVLVFVGGFVGYVVGTVLAGVFLVGDQVEQAIYRWTGQRTADLSEGDASHGAPI